MRTNIITAAFNTNNYVRTNPAYLYDHGMVLRITGVTLPSVYEVQFSNSKGSVSRTTLGGPNGVVIPDEYFRDGQQIYAWIYLHEGEGNGFTALEIEIPLAERPEDYEEIPSEAQASAIEQAITALNAAVAQTAADVASTHADVEQADSSAAAALESEENALASANAAASSATSASGAATNAANSATAAANSATAAARSASDAQSYISDAADEADRAEQAANDASGYATNAAASASSAASSAGTATTKAGEAAHSATAASQSASSASSSATAASGSASEAASSATNASNSATSAATSATAANTAKTAAEAAQGKAEDAQDAAETAASSVSASAAQIATNTSDIADLKSKFTANLIHDTATGSIANFPDGAALPVRDLSVDIEPVQNLNGYDNPWPAGGGKNLCSVNAYTLTKPSERTKSISINPIAAGTYTISWKSANGTETRMQGYDADNNSILGTINIANVGSKTVTISANLVRLYVYIPLTEPDGATVSISDLQIEAGSTATAFAPYSNICPISGWTGANIHVSPTTDAADGETYSITFPTSAGTVYGGTLDVTTGKLTVDRLYIDASTKTWQYQNATGDTKVFNFSITTITGLGLISNRFSTNIPSGTPGRMVYDGQQNFYAAFPASEISGNTDAAVKTWLTANPTYFVATLRTPIVYDLTPTEVTTLLGTNNVWADTGDTTVNYYADPTLYINRKIAAAVAAMS